MRSRPSTAHMSRAHTCTFKLHDSRHTQAHTLHWILSTPARVCAGERRRCRHALAHLITNQRSNPRADGKPRPQPWRLRQTCCHQDGIAIGWRNKKNVNVPHKTRYGTAFCRRAATAIIHNLWRARTPAEESPALMRLPNSGLTLPVRVSGVRIPLVNSPRHRLRHPTHG